MIAVGNPPITHPAVMPMTVVSEVRTSSQVQGFHLRIHRRMSLLPGYCCSHERYEYVLLEVTKLPRRHGSSTSLAGGIP
jgi:hypothetical protein